jgi:hypothetical protein
VSSFSSAANPSCTFCHAGRRHGPLAVPGASRFHPASSCPWRWLRVLLLLLVATVSPHHCHCPHHTCHPCHLLSVAPVSTGAMSSVVGVGDLASSCPCPVFVLVGLVIVPLSSFVHILVVIPLVFIVVMRAQQMRRSRGAHASG